MGAVLQECIDVAVIANALRALRAHHEDVRFNRDDTRLALRFSAEHRRIRADIDQLRAVADRLGVVPPAQGVAEVHAVHRLLVDEIEPHEQAEDAQLYPVVAHALGGTDPTGTMSRAHAEIHHLIMRLGRLLDELGTNGPDGDDIIELRRVLYGLHAILRLHTAQEDEGYLSLADDATEPDHPPAHTR